MLSRLIMFRKTKCIVTSWNLQTLNFELTFSNRILHGKPDFKGLIDEFKSPEMKTLEFIFNYYIEHEQYCSDVINIIFPDEQNASFCVFLFDLINKDMLLLQLFFSLFNLANVENKKVYY